MIDVAVYGYSDDLVEVEFTDVDTGTPLHAEEFPHYGEPMYLAFSEGTILKVNFDTDWTIKRVREGEGDCEISLREGHQVVASDDDQQARLVIDATTAWVVAGPHYEKVKIK